MNMVGSKLRNLKNCIILMLFLFAGYVDGSGKTAPGDTIYVDDTVAFFQFDFEKWFLPKQLELFAHGNTTMETATWYSRYSPFGQFMESRSIAGLGLIYRISHLSELNKFQNIMRWNSEFTLNVDVHYSKREFDRSIFGDYNYPNYYDGSKGLNYVQSNTGVTRYSSLWLMPEYRLCVRFSDFRENKGRLGIEGNIGIGFVGNIQMAASGDIVQVRDYYKYNGNSNYDYRYSESDYINYSAAQAKIDYPKYDGCITVRAGLYYQVNKSVKFSTGLQVTSTALGAETTDGYFRVHYLLGEQQNRKEAFKK